MVFESTVLGFRVIELIAGAFATGSAAIGLYIGYQAFRSLRRHDDASMLYLAMGLILLTTVTYTFTFLASVLIQLRWITLTQQDYFLTVAHLLQFTGLVFLAYALHRR